MKTKLSLSFIILLLTSTAFGSTKKSGTVYICSDSENTTKLTLDLSDNKASQIAALVVDGLKQVYYPSVHKQVSRKGKHANQIQNNLFAIAEKENFLFQLKKTHNSEPLIALVTDPETIHSTLEHSEPGLTIRKFNASLSAPDFHPANHEVIKTKNVEITCTETKWEY